MKTTEKVQVIAKILKRHFPNLTVEQTINIAAEIIDNLAVGES